MIQFSIPWIAERKSLESMLYKINSVSNKNTRISRVFYRPSDLQLSRLEDAKSMLMFLRQSGIKLSLTSSQRSGIVDFNSAFEKYLEDTGVYPDEIIVDKDSIEVVANSASVRKSNVGLYISTIAGVKDWGDINWAISLKNKYPLINSVCLHHDSVQDSKIKEKVEELRKFKIEPEVLVSESCFPNCPARKYHYLHLGLKHPEMDDTYQCFCIEKRFNGGSIDFSGFIHPDDIQPFCSFSGINHFKISGSPSTKDLDAQKSLLDRINAFCVGEIPENLYDLFVFTRSHDKFGARAFISTGAQKKSDKTSKDAYGMQHVFRGITEEEEKFADYSRVSQKLNRVYEKNPILSWQDLLMPQEAIDELKCLSPESKLLFPGCGPGLHAEQTRLMGFDNITATDISEIAIQSVRRNYPKLKSFVLPTQELARIRESGFTTFDIYNLHQIPPNELREYLRSIAKVSNKLFIAYIFEPEKGPSYKSDVPELGRIYDHDPSSVSTLLSSMRLQKDFSLNLPNNPLFFSGNPRINKIAGGIYVNL